MATSTTVLAVVVGPVRSGDLTRSDSCGGEAVTGVQKAETAATGPAASNWPHLGPMKPYHRSEGGLPAGTDYVSSVRVCVCVMGVVWSTSWGPVFGRVCVVVAVSLPWYVSGVGPVCSSGVFFFLRMGRSWCSWASPWLN